jgi:hypothetical protein
MQTAGLSDRELVPWVVDSVGGSVGGSVGCSVVTASFSHDSISEPCISNHLRFSSANSIAPFAASVAAPSSLASTICLSCQE